MDRIVFVIDSMGRGGAERVTSLLANTLAEKGKTVSIIALEKADSEYELDDRIRLSYYRTHNRVHGLSYIEYVKGLGALIREEAPDIVISLAVAKTNILLAMSLVFDNVKVVFSERNNPYTYPNDKKIRMIRDYIYNFADLIVFQTEDAQKYFSKNIQKKSCIIPNPVKKDLPYKNFDEKPEKRIVDFCRLDYQKNLPLLINAMTRIHKSFPEYTLVIYGEGYLKDELNKMIAERGADKYIAIEPFTNDIHTIMKKSALYVSSMLEAMAIGLPCICTDCPIGGARMVIEDKVNGLLVPTQNEDRMVEAIDYALRNYEQSIARAKKATEIRKRFSEEIIVDKWLTEIENRLKRESKSYEK